MKYFGIIDKNVAAIFQFQWKIGNISDMFLQYSVVCGYHTIFHLFSYLSNGISYHVPILFINIINNKINNYNKNNIWVY